MRFLFFTLIVFGSIHYSYAQDTQSLYKEGVEFHDAGEYNKAIEKYREALKLQPESGTLYYEMAFSYHALKEYDNAIVNADKAIALGSDDTKRMAIIVKGSVLDDMGKTDESIKFYEKHLKNYPNDYLLLYNYGISCSRAGKRIEAEEAYNNALTSRITHPGSNLQLAYLKKEDGEKMRPMLGLYFFLLLENNTERAKSAYQNLVEFSSLETKESQQINIMVPSGSKKDTDLMAAELTVSILGMTINEIDKKTRADSSVGKFENRFVSYTEKFIKLASGLAEKRNSSKKSKDKTVSVWWDKYAPFFTEIDKANHVEAFCYHIMLAGDSDMAKTWMNDNKEKRELFYLWLRNR